MKRVTSLRYVQIIPSPLTGSGVEVRQTIPTLSKSSSRIKVGNRQTFDILEGKNSETVVLCSVACDGKIKADTSP